MLVNLLASVTAGAISNTLTAPIWTIRTRMMTQTGHEDYRNTFHAAQKIYKTEGLYALYRGVIPSMWGLVSQINTYNSKSKSNFNHLDSCWYSISII